MSSLCRSTSTREERGEASGLSAADHLLAKIMAKLPPGETTVTGEQLPKEKGT